MLRSVQMRNIRALLDVSVDLRPFTVLVGPNGCGKSTLLDEIERICHFIGPEVQVGHTLGTLGRILQECDLGALRTNGTSDPLGWAATGENDAEALLVSVVDSKETPWWKGTTAVVKCSGDSATLTSMPDPSREKLAHFQALSAALGWRALRLRLMPDAVAEPCPVTLNELHPSGFGLATVLKDLAANDPAAYAAVQVDLKKVVTHFRELRFNKTIVEGVPANALELVMQGAGRVPASQVSDGTLLALALLTATHNRDLPWLILMDDIDHGLHLGAQYAMVKAIRAVMEVRPELQVVCTTHSPILLDSFDLAEVRVMALDANGHTRVKPLSAHPRLDEWRSTYSAGELWANLGEDWVLGD